jgi:hypothetical protein
MEYKLNLVERAKVNFLTLKDSVPFYLNSSFAIFTRKSQAMAELEALKTKLPEDLDDVLMVIGDTYAPSARLTNVLKGIIRRYDAEIRDEISMADYYKKLHTTIEAYEKAKNISFSTQAA